MHDCLWLTGAYTGQVRINQINRHNILSSWNPVRILSCCTCVGSMSFVCWCAWCDKASLAVFTQSLFGAISMYQALVHVWLCTWCDKVLSAGHPPGHMLGKPHSMGVSQWYSVGCTTMPMPLVHVWLCDYAHGVIRPHWQCCQQAILQGACLISLIHWECNSDRMYHSPNTISIPFMTVEHSGDEKS